MSVALDELRAKIRAIEGGPSVRRRRVASGVRALDEATGGLPSPGIVELIGPEGAGRCRIALALLAAHTRLGRWVAWVDPGGRLYPPAAADHGVDLGRLLVVRPREDGSSPWVWATEQLLRSARFPVVVVDLPERLGSRRALAHGWARAAEQGGAIAVVVTQRSIKEIPADLRVSVGGERFVVLRDRGGVCAGQDRPLPPWPGAADPTGGER